MRAGHGSVPNTWTTALFAIPNPVVPSTRMLADLSTLMIWLELLIAQGHCAMFGLKVITNYAKIKKGLYG